MLAPGSLRVPATHEALNSSSPVQDRSWLRVAERSLRSVAQFFSAFTQAFGCAPEPCGLHWSSLRRSRYPGHLVDTQRCSSYHSLLAEGQGFWNSCLLLLLCPPPVTRSTPVSSAHWRCLAGSPSRAEAPRYSSLQACALSISPRVKCTHLK